jgi:hypothetical protein|tara:strand:- start:244490 stop:244819 length:330 start_codon:yes stop_codon:yes gene_type:complete
MFKLAEEPTFRHTVTAKVPVDGGFEDQKFEATFRAIGMDEAEGFDMMDATSVKAFLARIIVELHDIGDVEGQALEYSDKVRDQVTRLPWARKAIVKAYFAALNGAKEGN